MSARSDRHISRRPSVPGLGVLIAVIAMGQTIAAQTGEPAAPVAELPDAGKAVSYAREISDILSAKCLGCHNAADAKGKLSLEDLAGMRRGGKRGPVVVPGKASESRLFVLAAHLDTPHMPPSESKLPALTTAELGLLARWIDAGAIDDSEESAAVAATHVGALPQSVHPIVAVDITDDGRRVAFGRGDRVRVYDADTGRLEVELGGQRDIVQSVRFSPDGQMLAVGSHQFVTLWRCAHTSERKTFQGPQSGVASLSLTDDHARLIITGRDGSISVWDLAAGTLERTIDATQTAREGADPQFAPSVIRLVDAHGARVATGSDTGDLHVVDLRTGAEVFRAKGEGKRVSTIAFSPSGTRIAAGFEDGAALVWEMDSRRIVSALALRGRTPKDPTPSIGALAFVGENGLIAGASDGIVKEWSFEGAWIKLAELGPHADRVTALDFNPDGTLLAAGSGEPSRTGDVTLWETGKGLHVRTWEQLHTDVVYGIRFSPDGSSLATASADKLVKILDVATRRELWTLEGHTHHVLGVDWSGDGRQVVSCGADGVLKLWDAKVGEVVRTSEPGDRAINAVRWSRGPGAATLATASAAREARLWNPRSFNVTRRFNGAEGVLFCVALSGDRTKLAAGGAEGVLYVWNPANARLVRRIGDDVTAPNAENP